MKEICLFESEENCNTCGWAVIINEKSENKLFATIAINWLIRQV